MILSNIDLKTNRETNEIYRVYAVFDDDTSPKYIAKSLKEFIYETTGESLNMEDDSLGQEVQYSLSKKNIKEEDKTVDYFILKNFQYSPFEKEKSKIEIKRTKECNHPSKTLENYVTHLKK